MNDECKHDGLDPPPRHLRIAACPDCGQMMLGNNNKWERGRGKIAVPFTDEDVMKQMLWCAFNPPQDMKGITRRASPDRRTARKT